jgi:UDP-N-acetylglucosamine 2-epimerase (non-hydrolysing)
VLTDHLSDVLFTTEDSANLNLKSEGINEKKIYFVGNTMIDSLVRFLPIAESRWKEIKKRIGSEEYILVTIHRPSNVDFKNILSEILKALAMINKRMPVIFPAHPRTLRNITGYNLNTIADGIHICEPVGYLDFLALEKHALLVITDSGGVQEETTFLGIPCLTVRPNSERPSTILLGTNQLVGKKTEQLYAACMMLLDTSRQKGSPQKRPPLWDGKAARRIVSVMTDSR